MNSDQSGSEFYDAPAVVTLGHCPGCGSMTVEPGQSTGCCEDVGTVTHITYAALCSKPVSVPDDYEGPEPKCGLFAGHKEPCAL